MISELHELSELSELNGGTGLSARTDYLTQLRKLAADCRSIEIPGQPDSPSDDTQDQLTVLARALERLERLEEQVNEMHMAQHSTTGMTVALERRVAALELSAPTAQSWRDLVQGIRAIRDVVLSQATQRSRPADDD